MSTTHDIAPQPVRDALAVLADLGDEKTAADVRALRDRALAITDHELAAATDTDALRTRLVADLVDGATTAEQAGEQIVDLERRTRAVHLGNGLFGEVRAELAERLQDAALAVADGWIIGMRPAVDRLAQALARAIKLTDGQLADVQAGHGTAAHQSTVDAVRAAYPLANSAQDTAKALREGGPDPDDPASPHWVPVDGLDEKNLHRYTGAARWADENAVREANRAGRLGPLGREEDLVVRLIAVARDYGLVPVLRTSAEIAALPPESSSGARMAAKDAERHQARLDATAEAQRKEAEAVPAGDYGHRS